MKGEAWAARVVTACAALSVALAGLYPGNNPDTFGHLAQGRQIAELGHVPEFDTWSLLPGPPRAWYNYEWLSDLGSYALYASAGYEAVTLFKCFLLAGAVAALASFAARLGGVRATWLSGLVVISTIPAIRIRLSDRPHVLGICLAALYLLGASVLASEGLARRKRLALLALLAVLHVIWVNAHGSHLLGATITGSFLVFAPQPCRVWLSAALGIELLACCVSPYGPAIVLDALDHIADARYRQLITEWMPWRETDPAWFQLGPALQGALLTVLAPRLARSSSSARAALAVSALLGVSSFRSVRFIAEFMLLSSPLLGAGLALVSARLAPRWLALGFAVATLALAAVVPAASASLPPHLPLGAHISFSGLPQASGRVLSRYGANPRVLASMQDSWFTMFAAPKARLVVDGRVPFYGPEHVVRVSRAFASQQAFDQIVAAYGVNTVLASHAALEDRELVGFGQARGFALVLIEDQHALYVREGALQAEAAAVLPPLAHLRPSYALGWILERAHASPGMRSELARLARFPGTGGYRAWVQGVLALSPLRRGQGSDGFRWPRDEADWAAYRKARPLIARAAEAALDVPVVAALHAEVATVFCDFDMADRALAHATHEGLSREPMLVAQELALRRGQLDTVRRVIAEARALPQGQKDPWLDELARGLNAPPHCP